MLRSLPPLENGRLRPQDRAEHPKVFRLRDGLTRVSRRAEPRRLPRLKPERLLIAMMIPGALWAGWSLFELTSKWPVGTAARHIAAFPNCAAARAMDLAPALRGQPGYYDRHDADDDGIACETWPRPVPNPRNAR